MKFEFHSHSEWPGLAWIARVEPRNARVIVEHGARVETSDRWFCEAVWNGDFAAGDFDLTDQVFGSGGRIREDGITFVSAGSTVDRLVWAEQDGATFISNSLACLMQRLGAMLDPTFARYQQFFGTILRGIDDYQPELQTSRGTIHLCYYRNLWWDGSRLSERDKTETASGFDCFEAYHDYLAGALAGIGKNLADPKRKNPFKYLGTISSGYDSACIATMARAGGLNEVISMSHCKTGASDSGEATAKALGLKLTLVNRDGWRDFDLPEAAFISSDAKGEDVYFRGAAEMLSGRVLLTGFQGGKLWEKGTKLAGRSICRSDRSGLSLTEYRLRAGFIHCPVPFMGARHVDDIVNISNCEAMKPWDFNGAYSKPIPRRIIEEAGVPRTAFGMEKKAASVVFHSARNLLSISTRIDFDLWLREHAGEFWKNRQIPPLAREALISPWQWLARHGWAIHDRTKWLPALRKFSRRVAEWGEKERLSWYLFPWAMERAKKAYEGEVLGGRGGGVPLRGDRFTGQREGVGCG